MEGMWNAELSGWVRGLALREGFDLAGVAPAPAADEDEGRLTSTRFAEWIDAERAGEMEYLKRRDEAGELLRKSARVALPWARSVVVCAMGYNGAGPHSIEPAEADRGWIARYAWNGGEGDGAADYHDDLMRRLKIVEQGLQAQVACQTRCYVDTGPLLERDFAARAGVGWVGKNTCVIHQELGSWLLLGVIVTSLDVAADAVVPLHPDRCGSCTRCIEACPTDALIAPRQMDASRCISYLTIELKGEIPVQLREGMGRQVFGCDICQDVCPWNRRAPIAEKAGLRTRGELVNPALEWLADMDDAEFKREFKGSPLERTKRRRVQRNVAIAMGNSGQTGFAGKLREWVEGDDGLLAEASAWALQRLGR